MDYRGSGLLVRDYQAEVWLYLLAQEARKVPAAPVWLIDARDDWETQATAGFMGCVSSCLDEHLETELDRTAFVLDLSERVLRRLHDWSPAIPKDLVNSFGAGGEQESFNSDPPTGPLLACGHAFISLLRGELPPGHDGWAR
ncbi:hypothetical protein [Salinispora arenicola]|uniref:hypothetical protein n=1 Tax=Salinispora arenicola TaxID=168697 RepID=UPI0020799663|nr:hypothetical protein [Salinispora arenicola]MCN0178243.1 hypothetical protein [Salinispora arenicola]